MYITVLLGVNHVQGCKQIYMTLCSIHACIISTEVLKSSSACFLDASKAFDRVNHTILFQLMMDRKLPTAVIRFFFLLLWYTTQELTVRWNASFSSPINVSNGVRQGGVISPILFTMYIDELFKRLLKSGKVATLIIISVVHSVMLMILCYYSSFSSSFGSPSC